MVAAALARVAKKDNLRQHHIEKLVDLVSRLDEVLDGLGFCLSEEPDQLSQWRGYADDGHGIAIGFDSEYLESLSEFLKGKNEPSFTLGRAEYEADEHDAQVEPTYRKAKEFIDQGALDYPGIRGLLDSRTKEEVEADRKRWEKAFRSVSFTMLALFAKLYLLKSPAFREEKEWRLIAYRGKTGDDGCEYHAALDRIVPYRTFNLHDLDVQPIREVILGPKHITPIPVIEDLLRQSGYANVDVRTSAASYR